MKPGPGRIVKTAILPGIQKSLDFSRDRSRQYRMLVINPGPGNIVKTAIFPGVDESLISIGLGPIIAGNSLFGRVPLWPDSENAYYAGS